MAFDHLARVPLGRTGLSVTRLGFGGASIGGIFTAVNDEDARATVRHAWDLGIRFFDTAPLYGYGASERRVGAALRGEHRDTFVLSTKVGRLVRKSDESAPTTSAIISASMAATTPSTSSPGPSASSSTIRPTASGGRSKRAWSGSGSSGSTSH